MVMSFAESITFLLKGEEADYELSCEEPCLRHWANWSHFKVKISRLHLAWL